jgi:hypothetical protein
MNEQFVMKFQSIIRFSHIKMKTEVIAEMLAPLITNITIKYPQYRHNSTNMAASGEHSTYTT